MSFIENLKDWQGKEVVDSEGEKIGRLIDAYYDAETDIPQFLVLEVGSLRKHQVLVPAGGLTVAPDHLSLPVSKDAVKNAPNVDAGDLSQSDEQAAFEHYGFQYSPANTPSGRRLVRH